MTYTEEEAKTKWCPFARVIASETDTLSAPHHTGYNRVFINADGFEDGGRTNRNPSMAHCIASDCMSWRWDRSLAMSGHAKPTQGFCGLAGQPNG